MGSNDKSIRRVITAGLLLAITLLLVFARIGMIPVPTPAGNATIAHIPAIIGGILEGPVVGLIVGLGFGFASFTSATIPLFKDPVVAVLPRLFIGLVAGWVYLALRRASKRTLGVMAVILAILMALFSYEVAKSTMWLGIVLGIASIAVAVALLWWLRNEDARIVGLAIAAAAGSLTNTVLVLSAAVLRGYFSADAALGIGLTHGIPEVVVSAIVAVAVVTALKGIGQRSRGSRL